METTDGDSKLPQLLVSTAGVYVFEGDYIYRDWHSCDDQSIVRR